MTDRWHSNPHGLEPAPINEGWILEGKPVTRCRLLSGSTDDMAMTAMWDCTAGRFHWYYDVDETICVLEGSIILIDPAGTRHTLHSMDTFFFPAGTRYDWTVPVYVRKIAFLHTPLSPKVRVARRLFRRVKGLLPGGSKPHRATLQGSASG